MRSGSPYAASVIAGCLVLAGFVMIVLGWKGGAATLFVPTQVAYGVSGGMVGFGLLGTGLAVFAVQTNRIAAARRTRDLQRLITDTVDVFAAVRERTADGTRPLEIPLPRPAAAPAAVAAAAGGAPETAAVTAARDAAIWKPKVLLIPGQQTFHKAGCRIVENSNKTPLHLTTEEAVAAELRPCRICAPA